MDYYGEMASGYDLLHGAEQQKKYAFIRAIIGSASDTWKILDVGAGTGIGLSYFENISGLEPSAKMIYEYHGSKTLIQGTAENLPFPDHSFDLIISVTALQNFADARMALREMKRVSKRYAISFLKRSQKREELLNAITEVLGPGRIEEGEIDLYYFNLGQ
ncbi:MAG: class I SAM-dependent methyltransferase [Candidatus Woesearchaeota archaeon]|nr:MAG: class I SAM-dependent methyltransferase [Candidatus Woesearchaeota archaeon]